MPTADTLAIDPGVAVMVLLQGWHQGKYLAQAEVNVAKLFGPVYLKDSKLLKPASQG